MRSNCGKVMRSQGRFHPAAKISGSGVCSLYCAEPRVVIRAVNEPSRSLPTVRRVLLKVPTSYIQIRIWKLGRREAKIIRLEKSFVKVHCQLYWSCVGCDKQGGALSIKPQHFIFEPPTFTSSKQQYSNTIYSGETDVECGAAVTDEGGHKYLGLHPR